MPDPNPSSRDITTPDDAARGFRRQVDRAGTESATTAGGQSRAAPLLNQVQARLTMVDGRLDGIEGRLAALLEIAKYRGRCKACRKAVCGDAEPDASGEVECWACQCHRLLEEQQGKRSAPG